MNLYELNQQMEAKTSELRGILDNAPKKQMPDGTSVPDLTADQVGEIQQRNSELNELGAKRDALAEAEGKIRAERKVGNRLDVASGPAQSKNIGEQFEEAAKSLIQAYNTNRTMGAKEINFSDGAEIKTTVTTAAGFAPFVNRSGVVMDTVQVQPALMDFLPVIPVSQTAYKWMKETTFTNNAGTKSEGSAYDEAALAWTEQTVAMERVGVHIPVTQEQLEDEAGVMELIQRRLAFMVRSKAGNQVINGDGTSPNWEGILNLAGIQTEAKGANPVFDAVMNAIVKVDTDAATTNGGAAANLVVMNLADYADLVLARTADGVYIYGNPADAPVQRLWGRQVITDQNLAAGTAIVLDTNFFSVAMRRNVTLSMTDSHGTDFIGNVLRFKADMRGNLISFRDAAACQVTGL
jgi:HK97 family phage major capsid protein